MAATVHRLTNREREVLAMVAEGRTNQAIGHALDLSPRTVAKHLERAYRKMNVSCRVLAVAQLPPPLGPSAAAP